MAEIRCFDNLAVYELIHENIGSDKPTLARFCCASCGEWSISRKEMRHMAKISSKASYLTADDLKKDEMTVEIVSEFTEVVKKYGNDEKTVVQGEVRLMNGMTKLWTLNNTTVERFIGAWGDDTSQWITHSVDIETEKQRCFGKERLILYGYPVILSKVK